MSEQRSKFSALIAVGIASPVIAAAIIGVWSSSSIGSVGQLFEKLNDSQMSMSRTQAVIQSQVLDVRTRLSGIYTQREADRAQSAIFRTDKDQYSRLDAIEKKILALTLRSTYGLRLHQQQQGKYGADRHQD